MKTRIKNYLSITKKEWNGMVILVILIALVLAAPYVYQLLHKDKVINFKDFDKAAAQLDKAGFNTVKTGNDDNSKSADDKLLNPVMFRFDPNGLSVAQWRALGLSTHQAGVIKHYEEKGGRFYKAEDVKRIYAITAADYKRLEPYILIAGENKGLKKAAPGEVIELNSADSAKLTGLRGIGPSFAERIVRYRNRLGGFYKKEQLREIYGFDSLKYEEIKGQISVDARHLRKININTISFEQLRIFPYFTYNQVNAIIEYRKQHGSYRSIADMRNIALLDDKILRKIEPYIAFK